MVRVAIGVPERGGGETVAAVEPDPSTEADAGHDRTIRGEAPNARVARLRRSAMVHGSVTAPLRPEHCAPVWCGNYRYPCSPERCPDGPGCAGTCGRAPAHRP